MVESITHADKHYFPRFFLRFCNEYLENDGRSEKRAGSRSGCENRQTGEEKKERFIKIPVGYTCWAPYEIEGKNGS